MSYHALYRKYRPSTLEDVIGQDIVIKILKNSVINDKVGHAYLFSGPRGIGKTTIAKAFSKTINCLNLKNGVSCEKCDNCLSINQGFSPDIIEIDAASNNGVDSIREIKNKISLVPNELKYKIYIIDEVHMLSIGAFNALLKTLEEPPEHVIFILATTDPQKVPTTIVSRCQCFEFHRISNKNIVERLKYISEKEKIKINDEVLEKIAELSDGGLRDAIGMLDKVNAFSNDLITIDDFEKVNGIVSKTEKEHFIDYVLNSDVTNIIEFIDSIYDSGKDLIIFVQDLLNECKNYCISYYVDNNKKYEINKLIDLSNLLNDVLRQVKTVHDVKTIIEINLLSFIDKYSININDDLAEKNIEKSDEIIENNENKVEANTTLNELEINVNNEIDIEAIVNNSFARASKENKQLFEKKWQTINEYALDSEYGAIASFLSDGVVRVVGDEEVVISFAYESMINRGLNLNDMVKKFFKKVYDKNYDIAFITNEDWEKYKQKYIEDKNNGIKYEYKKIETNNEIKKKNTNSGTITSEAINLFGDDVISVN